MVVSCAASPPPSPLAAAPPQTHLEAPSWKVPPRFARGTNVSGYSQSGFVTNTAVALLARRLGPADSCCYCQGGPEHTHTLTHTKCHKLLQAARERTEWRRAGGRQVHVDPNKNTALKSDACHGQIKKIRNYAGIQAALAHQFIIINSGLTSFTSTDRKEQIVTKASQYNN